MRTVIILAVFAVSSDALADDKRPWSLDACVSRVSLGNKHGTGGWMPGVAGQYSWYLGERLALQGGVDAGIFGFGGDAHWIGFLGGPTAGVSYDPDWNGLTFGGGIAADFGRIPVCNDWHLCLRYWGLFPRADVRVGYAMAGGVSIETSIAARYVTTLAWEGVSWEPSMVGRFSW